MFIDNVFVLFTLHSLFNEMERSRCSISLTDPVPWRLFQQFLHTQIKCFFFFNKISDFFLQIQVLSCMSEAPPIPPRGQMDGR